jgi:hypothetical protein
VVSNSSPNSPRLNRLFGEGCLYLDKKLCAVNTMKDTVNYILAADHVSDISDTIWQGDNDRQTVHLRSYAYVGLPTEIVNEFLHKLDKNRMLFHRTGIHLRSLYEHLRANQRRP